MGKPIDLLTLERTHQQLSVEAKGIRNELEVSIEDVWFRLSLDDVDRLVNILVSGKQYLLGLPELGIYPNGLNMFNWPAEDKKD